MVKKRRWGKASFLGMEALWKLALATVVVDAGCLRLRSSDTAYDSSTG
jgi:hypothetical protein